MVMTSIEAVQCLLSMGLSKYAIAKSIGAFPVSVDQWLAGTRMSIKYITKMKEIHGLTINDTL